ncbi:MAG: rhodanese-like domain-containing protein [Candidatus Omnitrophica bacterium]|nr:rhodanese-like domain-containing protein [Candidatus Omnitrophota bacterium]
MNAPLKKIKAAELKNLMAGGVSVEIIDVREPVEFQTEKVQGSKNVPLSGLGKNASEISTTKPVYVICQRGNRASQAAKKLESAGCEAYVIEGGLEECKRQGVSIESATAKVWSLERQVRFAAGALILAGILLSWFLHPAFIGLSIFVSAGLVFSAVTNTCGMAMILAKMPWNQRCGK